MLANNIENGELQLNPAEYSDYLLGKNLDRISLWNGEDNLLDILENNTHRVFTDQLPPRLAIHPVINLLAQKGFDHKEVLLKYGLTPIQYDKIMDNFLPSLEHYGMITLPSRRKSTFNPDLIWLQRHENHNEDMEWLRRTNINDDNYSNGQIITRLIKSQGESGIPGGENPLQGTFIQVLLFQFFLHKPWFCRMKYHLSHGERFERYYFYANFFKYYIDLDLMGSDHEEDLDERALLIFNKFLTLLQRGVQCGRFITLDGHGRLVRRVLEKITNFGNSLVNDRQRVLYNQAVNGLILTVAEIFLPNQIWHMNTLPKNLENEYSASFCDIFKYNVEDNAIIYFNFSGLGKQGPNCVEYINNLLSQRKEFHVVLSYSNVRGAIEATIPMTNYLKSIGMRLITLRSGSYDKLGDFLTFSF